MCLTLLALAEIVARRALGTPGTSDELSADPVLGFRGQPKRLTCSDERGVFDFVLNRLGFRGPVLPEPGTKRPGTERVLLLGDSFVQAWNVREEDWVGTVLREECARLGRPVEVYAVASNDYGTGQELLALQLYGERVQPDEVVLSLFPINDLINNTIELAGATSISPGDYFRPYLVPGESGALTTRYALPVRARLRSSVLFRHLEQRWLAGRSPESARAELTGEPILDPNQRLAAGLLPLSYQDIYLPPAPGGPWETAWKRTEALVQATRAEAERLGAGFTVVVVPELPQVLRTLASLEQEERLRAAGWKDPPAALDLEAPEQRLQRFFERTGTAHVELLGPLRRRAAEIRSPVYQNEGHLDGEGHRTMGRCIAQRLALGGRDVGYEFAGGPVDVLAFLGDLPLRFDFTQRQHWEVLSSGWSTWISPHSKVNPCGWGLTSSGLFLARSGFVTLEGVMLGRVSFPATLRVALESNPDKPIAESRVAKAGPFRLSFRSDEVSNGAQWVPLWLEIAGTGWNDDRKWPRLMLQSMRWEAEAPPGWKRKRPMRSAPIHESSAGGSAER